jgi:hypothetical protein
MNLSELNNRVTAAITIAEGHPIGSPQAWAAFREVSALEEAIAGLTAPGDVEGEIARVGAVAASLSAGEPLRAVRLAEVFLSEDLSWDVAAKVQHMLRDAHDQIQRALAEEPTVQPVTFTLRTAA